MKLWRDKKSGVYKVRFTVDGRRQQVSLKTEVKGQAETLALKALEDAKTRASGKEPAVSVAKVRELWLEANGKTASLGHWRNVSTWNPYCLEKVLISKVTTELAEVARNSHAEGRKPATVNAWVRILNILGTYAVQRGMMPDVPWHLKLQKVQKKPRRTLPASQVKAWIEAAEATAFKSHRWAIGTAIRMMVGMGMRETEVLGSRWEWIDWERKSYTVGKAKGFEARVIPIPAWLLAWLEPRKADIGLVLGEKHPSGFTRKAIAGANRALGITGISAHRLRGTFATLHSETGTPVQIIQSMLGHKSASTTMLYLEAHQEKAEEQQAEVAKKMGMA